MKQQHTLINAFKNAGNGLIHFFSRERNGRIQASIALITIATSTVLSLSPVEWILILFCIALVLGLEMMNSALEKLCDVVQPSYHPGIKIIKDGAAGAVLWAALLSALTGSIILLPKIFHWLCN